MSIFHPFVFPGYRGPDWRPDEERDEEEDYETTQQRSTMRKSYESTSIATTVAASTNQQQASIFGTIKNFLVGEMAQGAGSSSPVPEEKKQEENRKSIKKGDTSIRKSVSFELPPEDLLKSRTSVKLRGSIQYGDDLGEDELQRRIEQEKKLLESKDQILNDMRASHRSIHDLGRKSIRMNSVDMNIDDLDLQKLCKEQVDDIKEIEELHK